jgi:SpoVK/Ycf46/Vps4 family AAA+-type ATPase
MMHAMSDDSFKAANAEFIDLLIRRWELRLDYQIGLRQGFGGQLEPEAASKVFADTMAHLDGALSTLRTKGKRGVRSFPFDQVVKGYELDENEAQILELGLMPLLDLSFRQRIARLNNNILYDFVDVDLALSLLFDTRTERLQARRYFASEGPLILNKLLILASPKEAKGSGLLAQELKPPDRLADFVLCRRTLDVSLRPYAELSDPSTTLDDIALAGRDREDIQGLVRYFAGKKGGDGLSGGPFSLGEGLAIELVGPSGTGKTVLTHAVACELHRPLITVNCGRLSGAGEKFGDLVEHLFAEARVQGAVLLFDRCEPLFAKGNPRLPLVLDNLARFGGLSVLTTNRQDEVDPGVERYVAWQLKMEMPDVAQRQQIWRANLPKRVALAEDVDVEDLATRFEITGGQIKNACTVAETRALSSPPEHASVTHQMLKSAAQGQLRANMEDYSVRSRVSLTLDDLVLPDKEKVLVREVLDACSNRVFVMSKWGFGHRLVTGRGICVLFKGEPGTGKTLCAEILARELDMQLYQISIPKVVSKYIGDTEKNIAKIFSTARANHSMLLFDEADSLFTKRVTVENAIDRFSNMETNMLLQEIERFEGISILTTNLDKNIDDAFARRIQFRIEFPFPDAEHRELIWKSHFPKECPVDDDIDFHALGECFELTGGNIKNAVVRAAYRAAARQASISSADIEFAAEQECKNAGKIFRSISARQDKW